ncbi:MAG: DUF3450 domain-containing protein [Candidatus Pacebacteria bacterium]|nr:DUF3450 domain-containing protein [Candidatus Paceibacterota bacterium]
MLTRTIYNLLRGGGCNAPTSLVWRCRAGLLLACIGFLAVSHAPAETPALDTLENLVRQWVELRREIADTRADWQSTKGALERRRELLLQQKRELEKTRRRQQDTIKERESELASLQLERQNLQGALQAMLPPISTAEKELSAIYTRLPAFLRAELRPAVERLRPLTGETDALAVSERLQSVLSVFADIRKASNAVHSVTQVLEPPDAEKREMEILYLGVATGFAVSRDNILAAHGHPTQSGWTWSWQPELAMRIRRALDAYEKEGRAELVDLPLKIKEESLE